MRSPRPLHVNARPTPGEITGLLLAGGESRRFHPGSKARYRVRGRPMVAHVYAALRAVTGPTPLISVRPGTPPFADLEARYVEDCFPDAGPLAGLHAGLQAAATPWLLAVACDMPFLTPAALRSLVEACTPDADAVVTRTPDGQRQPLCACYRTRLLPAVQERLDARQLAMYAFLDQVKSIKTVRLPEAPLRNINERSDLQGAGD